MIWSGLLELLPIVITMGCAPEPTPSDTNRAAGSDP